MKSSKIDAASLAKLYVAFDTPVDALATDPERLQLFADAINRDARVTGKPVSGPELLKALFNARKGRLLPRLRRSA